MTLCEISASGYSFGVKRLIRYPSIRNIFKYIDIRMIDGARVVFFIERRKYSRFSILITILI